MILIDGPDGVQMLPVKPFSCLPADESSAPDHKGGQSMKTESLRLAHVLTLAELFRANAVLEDHGVPVFAETVTVGMVLDRVRWLEGRWRAHVIGELVAALSSNEE